MSYSAAASHLAIVLAHLIAVVLLQPTAFLSPTTGDTVLDTFDPFFFFRLTLVSSACKANKTFQIVQQAYGLHYVEERRVNGRLENGDPGGGTV